MLQFSAPSTAMAYFNDDTPYDGRVVLMKSDELAFLLFIVRSRYPLELFLTLHAWRSLGGTFIS